MSDLHPLVREFFDKLAALRVPKQVEGVSPEDDMAHKFNAMAQSLEELRDLAVSIPPAESPGATDRTPLEIENLWRHLLTHQHDWDQLAGGEAGVGGLQADDLLKIETTAADGTRTISTDNWADRLVHYEIVQAYTPGTDAPAPASSLLSSAYARVDHNTFLIGSSYGSTWQTIEDWSVYGGGVVEFQVQGSTGNLRWTWANASSWPGDTWYRIRAWAGAAKTDYDHSAT